MKNLIITFLFFIFATNNILLAQECLEGNCTDGFGKKRVLYKEFRDPTLFKTKGVYTGEFKNGKFHGEGTYLVEDWFDDFNKLVDQTITKIEYVFNEGLPVKAVYFEKGGFKYENTYEGKDNQGYALIKYGTYYFNTGKNTERLTANWKDGLPYGKVVHTYLKAGKFDPYIVEGTMKNPCSKDDTSGPQIHGAVTVTYKDGKKYENEYHCGAIIEGTSFLNKGSKLEGTYEITAFDDGTKEIKIYDGVKTYTDGKTVEYKKGKPMTLSAVQQNNQGNKNAIGKFTEIKKEAINAINKAQSCYNSLDGIGQSQIRSNLVDAKATFNEAKKLESDLKSINGDPIQSAGVYESATMQANVVVNIMCN